MRIWSLLPSATEILFALGLGSQVTGVSHECDYPPEAKRRPRVTRSFVDASRPGGEIHRQVEERLARGLPLYEVDWQRLHADPPDLIVTQGLCPVCAVSPSHLAGHLEGVPAKVLSLTPTTLGQVLESILQVGEATGRKEEARALVCSLRRRLEEVKGAVAGAPRPRVLCLEWLDPPMVAGHWVPEMVRAAGGEPVLISPGHPSRRIWWQEVAEAGPEVVVLMPCGFDARRAAAEAASLEGHGRWLELPAFWSLQVYAVDANAYFSRPGPRVVEGVQLLARLLHPGRWPRDPAPDAALRLGRLPGPGEASWGPLFRSLT